MLSTADADEMLSSVGKRGTRAVKVLDAPNRYRFERDSPIMVYIGSGLAVVFMPVGFALFLLGVMIIYQADVVEVLVDGKKERVRIVATLCRCCCRCTTPDNALSSDLDRSHRLEERQGEHHSVCCHRSPRSQAH